MEIEVKGHSGCNIEIVNNGKDLFINKSTNNIEYTPRLLKQAKKQQDASKTTYQHIRIPEIMEISQSDNGLNVKMEYIYSKNFIDYFEDAGFDQIEYFVRALKIFINSEIAESYLKEIEKQCLIDKFLDVTQKVAQNEHINTDYDVSEILRKSAIVFQELDNTIQIPIGICHGDLTFSNILFNGNNYYLIDFLDSFIETPLMDLVKIRQDSCYAWSLLMYSKKFDGVRMAIISKKIDLEIDNYYKQYEWYRKYYQIFQLMNFLRILQYAKEPQVIKYLKDTLKSML